MTGKRQSPRRLNLATSIGITLALLGFLLGALLVLVDLIAGFSNPMLSVVTYMAIPTVSVAALMLAVLGWIWGVVRRRRRGETLRLPVVDMNSKAVRRELTVALFALPIVLAITAVGGYRAYHFVESVDFCGRVCHNVMKPEYTSFHNSPHAGIACTSCHVGPGFKWFVKTKIAGVVELYSLALNKYDRPLHGPVGNLRPSDETCGSCHWREKSFGDVLRTWTHYLSDETNTPWTIVMKLNLGGGDPEEGPIFGIHWHVNGAKVEYVTQEEDRSVIPWVKVTHREGRVTIYRTTNKDEAIPDDVVATMPKRVMDCTDCHNRPSHEFLPPNEAMEHAMAVGKIDLSLPEIKSVAGKALTREYADEVEAHAKIADALREKYADHAGPGLERTISAVREIYSNNFFPWMQADWRASPHHIGHKWTQGCFRCHNGEHVSDDGKRIVHGCTDCHVIVSQGPGTKPRPLSPEALEFKHPEDIDEMWKEDSCDSCHTGAP